MELHSVPMKARPAYTAKIAAFNARIHGARKALLFSGAASSQVHSKLVQKQEQIEQKQVASTKLMNQACQQVHEMIAVGTQTAQELARQREQTTKLIESMGEVKAGIKAGNHLVTKMSDWKR